jgi:ADP-heptose:LPS heptosyltransferase
MGQTWRVTRRKVVALRMLDAIGGVSLMMPLLDSRRESDGRDPPDALRSAPLLAVWNDEREAATARLRESGIGPDDIVVAFHGGASDTWGQWPAESFERIAAALAERRAAKCVFILEPDAAERSITVASAVMRTSLREMMAVLTHCDLFIGNDSGPMHVADALGVAVVAVFLTGNPVWHRPYRPEQSVVGRGTGHDLLIAPTEAAVLAAAEAQLDRIAGKPRPPRTSAGGGTA